MAKNASDVLIEGLMDWGVDVIFGIPGDGINGPIEALRQRQDSIRYIQVRHEEAAAFMACAYAKYTGKIGCCMATSGPGGIHLLNGLYDAKMDQAPVVAITGQTYSDLIGSRYQQEVNMTLLFEDVTVYNQQVVNPNQVAMLVNEACRYALDHRGVSHLTIPIDYQEEEVTEKHSMHYVKGGQTAEWSRPSGIPSSANLANAADTLNKGERVAILAGQGALNAREELLRVAEMLGAPIVKALLGKAAVPDDSPYTTGGIGLLGTTPSAEVMESCDTLLIVGSSFPYMEYLPKPGQAKGIQIDDKADRIGLRFPVEVALVGDSKRSLQQLIPLLETKQNRTFLSKAQESMKDWRELIRVRGTSDKEPIKPQRVAWELSLITSDDAIISTDSGTITSWIAQEFVVRGNQKFSCSGSLATMAPGLPYAIAAKLAYPERQSIAFVGDGGFTMLMGEFATAVKYKLPIVVVVVKNNSLGMIKWEQLVFLGNPEYGVDLQPIDFAMFARACGGMGIAVDRPEDIRLALEQALVSQVPALVEVTVDPYEPPMPPKVNLSQIKHLAEALLRGEPNGKRIAQTIFRDKVAELF